MLIKIMEDIIALIDKYTILIAEMGTTAGQVMYTNWLALSSFLVLPEPQSVSMTQNFPFYSCSSP
jgi:hypothetical protein